MGTVPLSVFSVRDKLYVINIAFMYNESCFYWELEFPLVVFTKNYLKATLMWFSWGFDNILHAQYTNMLLTAFHKCNVYHNPNLCGFESLWLTGRNGEHGSADWENLAQDGFHAPGACTGTTCWRSGVLQYKELQPWLVQICVIPIDM